MGSLNIVRKFFPNVESVVDATRNAKIEVTVKDAASKAVRNHSACAMAVACKRKFKLDGVIISRSVAYLVKGKQARRFKLGASIAREIVSFDRGGGFELGVYELSVMPPASRQGARRRPTDERDHKNKGKAKRFRHLTTNARHVLGGQAPEGE